jgi:Fur family transcriptional regulator, ferric uptake regulator
VHTRGVSSPALRRPHRGASSVVAGSEAGPAAGAASAGGPDAQALVAEVAGRLRARGERMTGPRRAVLTAMAVHGGHLRAEDVVEAVAEVDASVHRASVYRTLEALSDLGVIQHLHVGHGGTAYHLIGGPGPHLHTQCRVCGVVGDLPGDLLDEVAAVLVRRHRFLLDAGHVALSGTCATCSGH